MNKRRGYKTEQDDHMGSPNEDSASHGIEQKKSRLEDFSEPTPSRVIHIRNVPSTASEEDIALLAVQFGRISNMIYARRNNQALLEMEDIGAASNMVSYYKPRSPMLHGRTCIVQFSRHSHLDTRSEKGVVDRAIQQANALFNSKRDGGLSGDALNFLSKSNSVSSTRGNDFGGNMETGLHSVLHVMLENRTNEPINHLLLYKVFNQFGRVMRIIMFTKMRTEHALIEYDSGTSALSAKLSLDNKALLGGRYPMRIEFSKNPQLEVRTENEKCRDFEHSPLTDMERYAVNALSMVTDLVVDCNVSMNPGTFMFNPAGAGALGMLGGSSGSSGVGMAMSSGAASFGTGMGGRGSGRDFPTQQDSANSPLTSLAAMMNLSRLGSNLGSGVPSGGPAGLPENWLAATSMLGGSNPMTNPSLMNLVGSNFADFSRMSQNNATRSTSRDSPVLIVSNLNETKVQPDALFTLFGLYGDVQRVKIMYNKKDTALIQFSDGAQAATARDNLNNVVLWEQPMKINISRHYSIQMPREDTDIGLTKDYTNSNLHRFKNPMSKNFKNIIPPRSMLHLSNIPLEATEEEITDLFQERGFDVVDFRFLLKDDSKRKMAIVKLPTEEDAILALIALHDYELGPTSHLRVSFSSHALHRNKSMD